jgi:thioredoxin-related protein
MLKIVKFIFVTLLALNVLNAEELNLNDSISKAKKESKHLMLFFHIPGCPYCKRMLERLTVR